MALGTADFTGVRVRIVVLTISASNDASSTCLVQSLSGLAFQHTFYLVSGKVVVRLTSDTGQNVSSLILIVAGF